MNATIGQPASRRLSLALVLMFWFVVPGIALLEQPIVSNASYVAVILHAFIVILCGLRVAQLAKSVEPRFLGLFFYVFSYFWFGLAPFVQLLTYSPVLRPVLRYGTEVTASAVLFLFVLAFDLVYRGTSPQATPIRTVEPPQASIGRLGIKSVVSLGTALVLVSALGGPSVLLSSRDGLTSAISARFPDLASSAIAYALVSVPPLVCLVAWILTRSRRRVPEAPLFIGLVLIPANALINGPFSHSRSWVAMAVLAVLLASLRKAGGNSTVGLVLGGVLAVAVFLPLADRFRFLSAAASTAEVGLGNSLSGSGDFDAYRQTVAGVAYVARNGLDYGYHLLGPVGFFVPRSLWASKPIDSGVAIAQFNRDQYTNLSAPLPIEFYLSYGVFGAIAVGLVVGMVWRKLDLRFADRFASGTLNGQDVFVVLLAGYQFAILRGSLLTMTGVLTFLILSSALIVRGSRHKQTPSRLADKPASPVS